MRLKSFSLLKALSMLPGGLSLARYCSSRRHGNRTSGHG
jgi:hypothetical protein